jgi:uncharacterized pyridoxal phosphate-containing UPF0001 family protein
VTALGRSAREAGRELEILVQAALDPVFRAGRGGADPDEVLALAEQVAAEEGLVLAGVMGVAPYPGDPDDAFARLQGLAQEVRTKWPAADVVSAGMSSDLEQAVAHGATQVRIGGAVLGDRSYVQ